MNTTHTRKKLSQKESNALIRALKERFEKNMNRHKGLDWAEVKGRLDASTEKLWSLGEMERTGGEPDVAVELEVVPEPPATALVAKARGAAVVVMGRGHPGLPFVKRLGPVTGEVLRLAACPVLVVDEKPLAPASRAREPRRATIA